MSLSVAWICLLILLSPCRTIKSEHQIYFNSEIQVTNNTLFIIAEPLQIQRVVKKNIIFHDKELFCSPEISDLTTSSIKAEFPLFQHSGWDHNTSSNIAATTFSKQTGQFWTLLRNGTLLEFIVSENALTLKQFYHFKYTTQRFYGQLFSFRSLLFVNYQGTIYQIVLGTQEWSLGSQIVADPVLSARGTDRSFYILTHTYLAVLNERKVLSILKASSGLFFVDFDVSDKIIFILTKRGILLVDSNTLAGNRFQPVQQSEWAQKIRISDKSMLIEYVRHQQSVIRQFYFQTYNFDLMKRTESRLLIQDLVRLYIRPGKIYRQFKGIRDISMVNQYGIVMGKSEINIFQANVRTEYPLPINQNRITWKQDQFVNIHHAKSTEEGLIMLVAGPTSIKIVAFKNVIQASNLFRGGLICQSKIQGSYSLKVEYIGICENVLRWQCQKEVSYQIDVRPQKKTSSLFFYFLTLSILLLVLCAGYLTLKTKLSQDIIRLKAIQQQNENIGHRQTYQQLKSQNISPQT